jgi:hypothetical protein
MLNRVLSQSTRIACFIAVLSPFSGYVSAATAFINYASVTSVLVSSATDGTYGGCMVALSLNPKSTLAACGNTWVTFGCDGVLVADPVRAYRLLDQAQLALVTSRKVQVGIDDTKKSPEGYCFAWRMDVK